MIARTAWDVALDDQVSAVLRDATAPLSVIDVANRVGMHTALQLREVWRSLYRLARVGKAQRIVPPHAPGRYWKGPEAT